MLAPLLCTLLSLQQPQGTPPPAAGAQDAAAGKADARPATPVVAWTDKEAKAAIDEFQRVLKGTPTLAERHDALEALARGCNRLLVKPLGTVVETDKSIVVRKRAVEALAQQPPADARPEVLRLLRSNRVQGTAPVMAALVAALARCGYQPADWQVLARMFDDYAAERVPLQEALLDLVAQHKEKQAIDLLLNNLDEPIPRDVDGAANPPAAYWEARWKAWKVWRARLKDALFAVTGQRFSTASEARAWLQKNPLR